MGTLALAPGPGGEPNPPRMAMLMYQTPLQSLDDATFQKQLSDFVDTAEAWIDYLANFQEGQESSNGELPEIDLSLPMLRV